jgi:hypothetical protein
VAPPAPEVRGPRPRPVGTHNQEERMVVIGLLLHVVLGVGIVL